jgi:hypothetical protein
VVGRAMNDPDKHRRKAAQVLLYSLVEGCSETIRPLLAEIMPVMYKGLDDPEMLVREHACLALAEFSRVWLGVFFFALILNPKYERRILRAASFIDTLWIVWIVTQIICKGRMHERVFGGLQFLRGWSLRVDVRAE